MREPKMAAMIRTKALRLLAAGLLAALALAPARAQAPRQDAAALREAAQRHLEQQAAGLPGKVTVTVGDIDPRTRLAPCPALQAFQPPGARAWGNTTVGIRCGAPAWTIFVQARVSVVAAYVASAVPLAQGKPIDESQLALLTGDLADLPNGMATDKAQVVGRSPLVSLPAGAPLRIDTLKAQPVVQQGQLVKVVSGGPGFQVSAQARALGNAAEGQVVQVRTPSGAILSGVARTGAVVEMALN